MQLDPAERSGVDKVNSVPGVFDCLGGSFHSREAKRCLYYNKKVYFYLSLSVDGRAV